MIFRQGTAAQDVFLLMSGLVILTCDAGDGSEGVLGLRFPGQVLDYCAHGFGMPYPVSAATIERSILCRVPLAAFATKMQSNIHAANFFERLLRIDLYSAAMFIGDLKTATPSDRFEGFLRFYADATGQASTIGSLGVLVPLRDGQLAELIGLSERHFKRVTRQLQMSGRLQLKGRHHFVLGD